MEATNGVGMDACFEASGSPSAAANCVEALGYNKKIVVAIGHSKVSLEKFFQSEIVKREASFVGSRNAVGSDFEKAIQILLENFDIKKMITNIYNFNNTAKAFEDLVLKDNKLRLKSLLSFD